MNQLLVLDLDGTLLRNDKTASEEMVNSLFVLRLMINYIQNM